MSIWSLPVSSDQNCNPPFPSSNLPVLGDTMEVFAAASRRFVFGADLHSYECQFGQGGKDQ